MIVSRLKKDEFVLPTGRCELPARRPYYDFVIDGEVADQAHCVVGVATRPRPAFYKCKSQ
jgi:hypothetical protein